MVQAAIDRVHATLEATVGKDLLSLYHYGSMQPPPSPPQQADVNLLAVVGDDVSLHQLREAFLPLWAEEADTLRRTPLVATRATFRRHLNLFPLFAYHLARHGACVAGASLFQEEPEPPNPAERAAYLAHQALRASTALAPQLLSPEQTEQAHARLVRLAHYLDGDPPTTGATAGELFTRVQAALRAVLENLPGHHPAARERVIDSEDVPNLQAVYQETDHTVILLPALSSRLLRQLDWAQLAGRLQEQHRSLQVTTAPQLKLILQSEATLDFALARYEHEWGRDPLDGLQVSTWAMWRTAGRMPSRILVDDLPGAYLAAGDEEGIHKIIHDFQNRLLNMRLQHELLHRLHGFEAAAPPEPLPGRDEALPARIDAIMAHLDWWATYYEAQMKQTGMSEKLSAP